MLLSLLVILFSAFVFAQSETDCGNNIRCKMILAQTTKNVSACEGLTENEKINCENLIKESSQDEEKKNLSVTIPPNEKEDSSFLNYILPIIVVLLLALSYYLFKIFSKR